MSEGLERRAEVLKLARLLACEPDAVAFLERVPSSELRALREQATARLFDAPLLSRVGAAARLVPTSVSATIAERAFGPLLCARVASSVDPDRAIEVCRRLPAPFLADTAIEVDPRSVAPIIAAIPDELVLAVAEILDARREYVTMGRFLGFVNERTIATAVEALSDEALLRTAFVLEHKDRLDGAVALLPAARLPSLIAHASTLGLWPEILDLLDHLSPERQAPLLALFAEQPGSVIAEVVDAVSAGQLWDALLPLVRLMAPEDRRRLATTSAFHDERVLTEIIDAAAAPAAGLWVDMAPLVAELPPEAHRRVARIAGALEPDRMLAILSDAATQLDALLPLVSLVGEMDEVQRAALGDALTRLISSDRTLLDGVIRHAAATGRWPELVPLLEVVPEAIVQDAAIVVASLSSGELIAVLRDGAADGPDADVVFSRLLAAMGDDDLERVTATLAELPEDELAPLQARFDALSEPS